MQNDHVFSNITQTALERIFRNVSHDDFALYIYLTTVIPYSVMPSLSVLAKHYGASSRSVMTIVDAIAIVREVLTNDHKKEIKP